MNCKVVSLKSKILVFTGYYLPGFKAGGPVKSVSNLIENLGDVFDFYVVTRDRDLGDACAYAGLIPGEWVCVGRAKVLYVDTSDFSVSSMLRILREVNPEIVYLVSFFNAAFTTRYLILRYFKYAPLSSVIIAPQGEFSEGALKIKRMKKRFYLALVNFFGLCRGIFYHASSQFDFADIRSVLGVPEEKIKVAIELPSRQIFDVNRISSERESKDQRLHVVFLSRIVKMKNLVYALECLSLVKSDVVFDIYGPLEDEAYWSICAELISKLPSNVSSRYLGHVDACDVGRVFSGYDLFLFPSLGEGYGHVIAEALGVGTTVLISDKTPWRNLQDDFLGWDLPLDNKKAFVEKIEYLSGVDLSERLINRDIVLKNAARRIVNPENLQANVELFESLIARS